MITQLRGEDMNNAPLWEARLVKDFRNDWVTWMSSGHKMTGLVTHTWGEDHQGKGLQSVISFWLNQLPETDSIKTDDGGIVVVNQVIPDEKARLITRQLTGEGL